jgi:hypothetical protein
VPCCLSETRTSYASRVQVGGLQERNLSKVVTATSE